MFCHALVIYILGTEYLLFKLHFVWCIALRKKQITEFFMALCENTNHELIHGLVSIFLLKSFRQRFSSIIHYCMGFKGE